MKSESNIDKKAFLALLVLIVIISATAHFWPEFRSCLEYLVPGEGGCR